MHDNKDGGVGVASDGCTHSTATKERTGLRNGEPYSLHEQIKRNKKTERAHKEEGTDLALAAKKTSREVHKRQKDTLTCGGCDRQYAYIGCKREERVLA